MKTYEPTKAASILKTGPSGKTYHFIKEHEVGPHSLADERWMENLVSLGVLQVVTNDREEAKVEEKPQKKVMTAKDVLPSHLSEKQPEKKKIGRKTKEEKEAEEKVAKQNEKAEKEAKEKSLDGPEFEDEQQQEFVAFVKTLRGKDYDQMVDAIYAEYLKDYVVEVGEKFDVETDDRTKREIIQDILDKL